MSDNTIHISQPPLNLYFLSQTVNNEYDTYDSCIVAAASEEDAKTIGPNGQVFPDEHWRNTAWAFGINDIEAQLIGTAVPGTKRGVILASFNAG